MNRCAPTSAAKTSARTPENAIPEASAVPQKNRWFRRRELFKVTTSIVQGTRIRWRKVRPAGKVRLVVVAALGATLVVGLILTAEDSRASGSSGDEYIYDQYFVHTDHLMSPVRMTNAEGALVWYASYDPFGKSYVLDEDPDQDEMPVTMNFRFPGQYFDAETGLHYNWFRFYDPEIGRYLQPEIGGTLTALGTHAAMRTILANYSYAANNPLGRFDVLGFGDDNATLLFYNVNVYLPAPLVGGAMSFGYTRSNTGVSFYGFVGPGVGVPSVSLTYAGRPPKSGILTTLQIDAVFSYAASEGFAEALEGDPLHEFGWAFPFFPNLFFGIGLSAPEVPLKMVNMGKVVEEGSCWWVTKGR